jgi:DNA polymerase
MDDREKAKALEDLYTRIQSDPNYRSLTMGIVFVPGSGSLVGEPVVFVGEAPGKDEEREQRPFVGAAGKNLLELLRGVGLSRSDVFITNLIKYRPVNPDGSNRAPRPSESRVAVPYLLSELEILSPSLVVCLGLSAAKALLNKPALRMSEANGTLYTRDNLRVLVTYHPSPFNYLIEEKKRALKDAFRRIHDIVSTQTGSG